MLADDKCGQAEAVYPGEVNAARYYVVLIADVSLESLGMKEVGVMRGFTREELTHKARKRYPLKPGAVCKVAVGNHKEFDSLVYHGRKRLRSAVHRQDTFYHFSQDGNTVLTFSGYTYFVEIDGKKVENI